MKKSKKIVLCTILGLSFIVLIVYSGSIIYFKGISRVVGDIKYDYITRDIRVNYGDIQLYGKALIPKDDNRDQFPTVVYSHGAQSNHKADMTTLQSLAKSGIACYTFDYYGWTDKSTGPDGKGKFMRGADYPEFVLNEIEDLSAVIDQVLTMEFVDKEHVYLVGSSMGGCVAALTAEKYNNDLAGLILQYPAIFLNQETQIAGSKYDVNKFEKNVLILHGDEDKVVDWKYSNELNDYYNTLRPDHSKLITYKGQPHVFTGKYKVEAAKEIYKFIMDNQ